MLGLVAVISGIIGILKSKKKTSNNTGSGINALRRPNIYGLQTVF